VNGVVDCFQERGRGAAAGGAGVGELQERMAWSIPCANGWEKLSPGALEQGKGEGRPERGRGSPVGADFEESPMAVPRLWRKILGSLGSLWWNWERGKGEEGWGFL
jgi:hypothetical protein